MLRALYIGLLVLISQYQASEALSVAVIGGGIGGAAFSYYLNKLTPNAHIDIYERNEIVGGRLKHITFGGKVCEVGGDAWSSVNSYMMHIMKDLHVPITNNSFAGNGKTGLYAGDKAWLPMDRRLKDELEVLAVIEKFRVKLELNYLERGNSVYFENIDEFAHFGGLNSFTSVSTKDLLNRIPNEAIWTDVLPITRCIYDQGLEINGFGGIVSLLPAVTAAYSVEGGNSRIVEMMITASKANLKLNSEVKKISWNGDSYSITNNGQTNKYDAVIIATPLEFTSIQFPNVSVVSPLQRSFVHWFVTLVEAKGLSPSYFGLNPVPDAVITTLNSTAPFVVINPIDQSVSGATIYKIFSNVNMSQYLDDVFVGIQDSYIQHWPQTFPDLSPTSNYQPIKLAKNLLYLNTIESLASAMEASVISGRNAALWISKTDKL